MDKENNYKKPIYIRPEDTIKLILRNFRKWKSLDEIENNLNKILWYLEDERYNILSNEFKIEI